jgi:hypothetical protein
MKRVVLALPLLFAALTGGFAQSANDFTTAVENGTVTITGYTGNSKKLLTDAPRSAC